eukprot:3843586-Rhodomonas_salina.1
MVLMAIRLRACYTACGTERGYGLLHPEIKHKKPHSWTEEEVMRVQLRLLTAGTARLYRAMPYTAMCGTATAYGAMPCAVLT